MGEDEDAVTIETIVTADDYEAAAAKTAVFADGVALPYVTLGLCSEAAELLHAYTVRQSADIIIAELGDVCWYVSQVAALIGVPFRELFVAERGVSVNDMSTWTRITSGVLMALADDGHTPNPRDQINFISKNAGSVAGLAKRVLRGDVEAIDAERTKEHLELIMMSATILSLHHGFGMQQVLQININKLRSRQARGVLKGEGDGR